MCFSDIFEADVALDRGKQRVGVKVWEKCGIRLKVCSLVL